ncbi:MAG: hypothetical protein NC313_10035 [Butyrivibrio sp.]|nr:hypothetical protein [Butyrivibrio sp.]
MAQIVNLRQTEYQTIVTELSKMHTDQLQCVADAITKLRNIVTSDDIFSANQTSKKMEDMLDMAASDIVSLLEQAFNDSEAGIANMITSITTTDSACG